MLLREPLGRFIKDCLLQGTVLGTVGYRKRATPCPEELTIWRETRLHTRTAGRHTGGQRQPGAAVSPGVPVPVHLRGTRHGWQLLRRTSRRTDACGRLHHPPRTLGTRGRGAWGIWGRGKATVGRGSRATQRHRGETGSKGGLGSKADR